MTRWLQLIGFLSVVALTAAPAAQQTSRDAPGRAAFGTATISGTLVSDDDEKRPIRRAVITLNGAEIRNGRISVTDDQGRFVFPDLPAGRYTVTGSRPAYVTSYYGARQSWRGPSSTVTLAEGQHLAIAMRMLHGAVVAGTLFDSLGRPQVNARVMAVRFRMNAGERQILFAGGLNATTDDRGAYRLYGLAPGEYAIAASVTGNADSRQITAPEIQWAQQQIQRAGQATPGVTSSWIGGPPPPPGPSMGYAPVFYPGTTDPAAATVLTIGPGEVRESVDFPLQFVATSRLEGTVVDPDGRPAATAIINLFAKRAVFLLTPFTTTSRTDSAGKFVLSGVLPGDYTLIARSQPGGPPAPAASRGSGAAPRPMLWAQQDLSVSGNDMTGLSLRLQTGLTVSGRVAFEGTTAPPADLSRIRVSLGPSQNGGTSVLVGDPQMNADGTFTFQGATPGRYRVNATLPPLAPGGGGAQAPQTPTWTLKSVVYNDVDTLDSALEVSTTDLSGIVITFTDRPTELSGTLLDPAGHPTPEYWVVAFTSNRTFWAQTGRRLRTVRPDADGKFQIAGLPPGEYCLAALTDLEQADLADPSFLEQLAAASIKITLAEGEKKKQDLKLSGGSPD